LNPEVTLDRLPARGTSKVVNLPSGLCGNATNALMASSSPFS
jgi:hypothetical protein